MNEASDAYQILPLTERDFEQTAEVLSGYWNIPVVSSRKRLRWKYLDCPSAKKELFYIALFESRVVGTLGFFPIPFQLKGRNVNILCPGDAFTSPGHRRFGVYTKLFLHGHRELSQHYDFFVSLSASPHSATGLLKIGWKPVAMRKAQSCFLFKPTLLYFFNKNTKNSTALLFNTKEIVKLYDLIPSYPQIDNQTCCVPIAERKYMEWRFSNPTQRYAAIPYYEKGVLLAFAVFMLTARDAFLLDYREVENANVLPSVLHLIKRHVQVPRLMLPVFIFSIEQQKILSRCGFYDYRPLLNLFFDRPKVPILVHPVMEKPATQHWYVQGLDMGISSHWMLPEFCNDGY